MKVVLGYINGESIMPGLPFPDQGCKGALAKH